MRVLQYPGSKWSYASWICGYIPEHKFYLEPFFGSGAIFFNKRPADYETINDLDSRVTNLFSVIRNHPEELARAIDNTPYAREEYYSILEASAGQYEITGNKIEDARRFLVRCNQSFGSSTSDRTGWKNSKSSSGPANARQWNALPPKILRVSKRLKNAQIENTDALELMKACDGVDSFMYIDPPYPFELRHNRLYSCELGQWEEHITLLEILQKLKSKVIISGYDNDIYDNYLAGWHKEYRNGLSTASSKKQEVIWLNYSIQQTFY